jgi:hypothetical protein
VTSTLAVVQPIAIDGQGRLTLNASNLGGLTGGGVALSLKLDTNPGLVTTANGTKVLVNANGAITLDASGLAAHVDGTTLQIANNTLSVKTVGAGQLGIVTTKGDLLTFSTTPDRLAVGSNGQVLVADSTATTGLKWANNSAVSVTTKGDIQTFSTVADRLPVGSDGQVLTANSTATTGLSWGTVLTNPMTTAADIIIGGASGAPTRLAAGNDTEVLTMVSGSPAWAAPSGGGGGGNATSPLTTKGDIWVFGTADDRLPVGSDGKVLTANSTATTGLSWETPSGGGGSGLAAVNITFTNVGKALNRGAWVAGPGCSNSGLFANALDGSSSTSWATSGAMVVGSTYSVDFGTTRTVGSFLMDVSASGTDFPTKFDVDKSNDGTTWTSVETNITGAQYNVHNFSSPFTCRYIRFVVSTISSGHNWQITNLNLFDDKIQTAETVGSSSSSFSGSAGKALTVRGVFARSTQNHDLGFRVGVDSSNWYGFQCVGTGVRIKRSIAGTVTDLVTNGSFGADWQPHAFDFTISIGPTGRNHITLATTSSTAESRSVGIIDEKLDFTSGTITFFPYGLTVDSFLNVGFVFDSAHQ